MILLWGPPQDSPLAMVRDALAEQGAPVFFLDQARSGETDMDCRMDRGIAGSIRVGEAACDLEAVSAVYVRYHDPESFDPTGSRAQNHTALLDEAVAAWVSVTPARVVNPFEAMASNGSKPYQLSLIREAGFSIPDTLVSTDREAVELFWNQHRQIIYKSVSGVRSIVSRLKAGDRARLVDLRWCPTQFQEYVPGRDYRVHTVGQQAFACEILSEADDYRYGDREGLPAEINGYALPEDCAQRCRALAVSLGLPVAGIDLRRTPEGEWFCFEVNPSPAFSYYEQATDQPIAEAIAALLAGDLR